MARVVFQWLEILPWFVLSEARQNSFHETLLLKVMPRLICARDATDKLKAGLQDIHENSPTAPKPDALQQLATTFIVEAQQGLEEFAAVFGFLLGRKAPDRNYAALAKWAEKWFGAEDRLCIRLKFANANVIKRLADLRARLARGGKLNITPGGTLAEATWGLAGEPAVSLAPYLESLTTQVVPFIEETITAALHHLPIHGPITLQEIPEVERAKVAPVRFRVMTQANDGELVPAGKVTKDGNVVPELQRMLQQGRGKPIIASRFKGEWFVATGSKMYHSARWQNFHDFLGFYIKEVLHGEWANLELKKPREERHPLMVWYEDVTRFSNAHLEQGTHAPMTSLVAAYLGLAYNLYLISHNNGKVHEALVRRLKQKDQFLGAYHEAAVTGLMIRAGFDIELEDESDITSSHCEFTATHRESGQRLSVEAKMRQVKPSDQPKPPQIRWLLGAALKKKANHPRLVFIEVNDETTPPDAQKKLLLDLLATVRGKEANLLIDGQPAPSAYLVVINNPPATVDRPYAPAYMFEGFKIPDYRVEGTYLSLREALAARAKHRAMFALHQSLRDFIQIPATFDGETLAFSMPLSRGRLLLGRRYCIETPDGEVRGELVHAQVLVNDKTAWCCLREKDHDQMVFVPLTDQELKAYHESPRTFFGREEPKTKIDSPLEFYDSILKRYRHNSKDALLGLLGQMGSQDLEELKALSQEHLAEVFAERTTEAIIAQTGLGKVDKGAAPPQV
ncbi:MAG: hypothetical protein QG602_2921 [Verrucomicrobiota bacterium]|nr:hypothetical protein [Verrucomicrobiota bacterium]